MAPVIADQRIGAATAAQGRARGEARVGLAAAVVAEVDRQVAGRGHRQDDDLGHQRAARERQLEVEARQDRLGGEPDHPAGQDRHDRPPEALNGRERDQADQDHADERQPPAVDLDAVNPSARSTGGPTTAGRPSRCRAANASAMPPQAGVVVDHVVLGRLSQPDHDRGRRARRVDQRCPGTAGDASAVP